MNVLIAGCGYVGTELGLRLAAAEHRVWGLRRSPGTLPPPLRPVTADLADPASLSGLPEDLDAVVYAASADARDADSYRSAYVAGIENLRSVLDPGVRRFVLVSSTAVYGDRRGAEVDEATEPAPDDYRGEILLEAEQAARKWSAPTVVRASGIYGPGRNRLLRRAERTRGRLEGADRWTNRVHRDDLAAVLHHALERDVPTPLYVASDRGPVRLSELLAGLAAGLDTEVPAPAADAPAGPSIPGKRCVPRRLVEERFRFRFPTWREGYRPLLAAGAAP